MIKFIDKGKIYEVCGESDAIVEALRDAYTSDTKIKVMDTKTNEIYSLDPHTLIESNKVEERNGTIAIVKHSKVESNTIESCTEKEVAVLKAMYDNTDEIGLPVDTDTIKIETGYSKRSIVGIVGSLHKKGLLESYDLELESEYMLSEKAFSMLEGLDE